MNILSSLRIFDSFCKTCHDNVALKSSILVNYVPRSALQKCELDHNSWPKFISAIKTEPGKLNCSYCGTPIDAYGSQAKFTFIEFCPDRMDLITLCGNINVGSSEYKLKLDVAGTSVRIQNILSKNYKNKTTRQPQKTKKSYSSAGQLW